jgi:hypothetical protein
LGRYFIGVTQNIHQRVPGVVSNLKDNHITYNARQYPHAMENKYARGSEEKDVATLDQSKSTGSNTPMH